MQGFETSRVAGWAASYKIVASGDYFEVQLEPFSGTRINSAGFARVNEVPFPLVSVCDERTVAVIDHPSRDGNIPPLGLQ